MNGSKKNGFTLAELLIVVAIIAVLIAIMIPLLNNQLERSRQTADVANMRSAYSEAIADTLNNASGDMDVSGGSTMNTNQFQVEITRHHNTYDLLEEELPFEFSSSFERETDSPGTYWVYFVLSTRSDPTTTGAGGSRISTTATIMCAGEAW